MENVSPGKSTCITGHLASNLRHFRRVPSRSQTLQEDTLAPCLHQAITGWNGNASHLILPSRSKTNDNSRSHNLGRPKTGTNRRPSSAPNRLRRSASAPTMPSGKACSSKSIAALDPNTPRSQRGLVRSASVTAIQYPSMPIYVDTKDLHKCRRLGGVKPPVPSHQIASSPVAKKRPASAPAGKRVSFTDDVEVIDSNMSLALRRSKTLLSSLYELRRAGRGNDANESKDDAAQVAVEAVEETLMNSTLSDVLDDSKALQNTLTHLENARDPVHDAGGARHASTLVAGRTLGVVKRKLFLVQALEKRLDEYRNTVARNEVVLNEIINHESDPPLMQKLLGVPQFLRLYLHKDGQPIDADKTDFDSFVATFGLPSKHHHVISLRRLAEEAMDWWATKALSEAESGSSATTIRRLLAVASGINGNSNHNAMRECNDILADRLAKEVLALAEKMQKKDADTASLSKEVQPQSAKDAAAMINNEITAAVKHGASPKHASIELAKTIANELSVLEKKRYALKALRFAEVAHARDQENVKRAPDGVPEVGPASEQADLIEKEITRAINSGASEYDPSLQEAHKIAKSLRDADGERKRLKARQKRLTSATASA